MCAVKLFFQRMGEHGHTLLHLVILRASSGPSPSGGLDESSFTRRRERLVGRLLAASAAAAAAAAAAVLDAVSGEGDGRRTALHMAAACGSLHWCVEMLLVSNSRTF